MTDQPPITHVVEHGALAGVLIAGFIGFLPTVLTIIGSAAAFIWFVICIKESRTYIEWRRNRLSHKHAKRLMKLRAREKVVLAKIEAAELVRAARVAARDLLEHEIAEAAKLVAQNDIILKSNTLSAEEVMKAAKERLLTAPDAPAPLKTGEKLDPNKMP